MTPEAIVFDVDGTLAETDEVHRQAFNLAFRDVGLSWRWSFKTYSALHPLLSAEDKIHAYLLDHPVRHLDDPADLAGQIVRHQGLHYRRLLESGAVALRPGVARLIQDAWSAGVKLGIAGLARRLDCEILLLNHLGIRGLDYFDSVVTAEDLGPQPTQKLAYRRVVEALCVNPRLSFAIDDSEAGIAAAQSAGLNTIATPGLYTSSCRFGFARYVFSDLGHPAAPFQIIKGDAGRFPFVSVEALSSWLDTGARSAVA